MYSTVIIFSIFSSRNFLISLQSKAAPTFSGWILSVIRIILALMNGTTFYTNFHFSIKTITKTGRCTSVWGDIWFDFKNFIGILSSIVQYIFIAPYSLEGGIGLVTIKVFSTTTNLKRKKYERKQQNYTAYTISIIIIL